MKVNFANRIVLHPFLFALFPVVSLFLNNMAVLQPDSLFRAVLVLELAVVLLLGLLRLIFRNVQAAAVAVSLLMFVFFIHKPWGACGMPVIWTVLLAVLVVVGRRRPAWLARVSPVLNVMAGMVLLLQCAQYVRATRRVDMKPVPVAMASAPDPKALPHIIHIIADEFGRPDIIRSQFGCDLGFMVESLRSNGFFVADHARANYMQTMQGVASLMAMNYLPGSAPETAGEPRLSRVQLTGSFPQSSVVRTLSRLGYHCQVRVSDGNVMTDWATGEDPDAILNFSERILLEKSCLRPFISMPSDQVLDERLYAHYRRTKNMLLHEADCVRQPDPVYKLIHIVSPHAPYVFAVDGAYHKTKCVSEYIFSPAAAFGPARDLWRYQWDEYAEQVQFIAAELCRMVERILKESSRPVVIILQGDHGPGGEQGAPFLEGRSGILMAVRIPGQTNAMPAEFQSPVNIYRHLFRQLWQADMPLLPTRIYKSEWESPDIFEDVTAQVNTQRCAWTFAGNVERGEVKTFLSATASSWVETNVQGWALMDDIRHCGWSPQAAAGGVMQADRDAANAPALVDADMSTIWKTVLETGETARISISFPEPTVVCGLRFISSSRTWPGIRGLGVTTGQGDRMVLTNWVPSGFFWSGSNIYQQDLRHEAEVLFEPREVRRLDVEIFGVSQKGLVSLNGMEWLAPAPEPWPADWREEEIYQAVVSGGARRLYGPRWLERYGYEKSGGRLAVGLPVAYYRRGACYYWKDASSALDPLRLTPDTVVVGYQADAVNSEAAFRRAGVAPHVRTLGPYVLFGFDEKNWKEEYRYCEKLYRLECGVRYGSDDRKVKQQARYFFKQSRRPGLSVAQKAGMLARCVAVYPDYQPGWLDLADLYRQAGDTQAAQSAQRQWRRRTQPPVPLAAAFERGVKLLGYDLAASRLENGRQGRLVCYWQVPPDLNPQQWAVFLHFRQGKQQFQGDGVLLENYPEHLTADQPFPEVFRQEMTFTVPEDFPGGIYDIYMGLYDRGTGRRLKVKSEYAAPKRCVKVPASLTVVQE